MDSGRSDNRSAAISLLYYSWAKASRSLFSCSSGRLVEMISKSQGLPARSITLSSAVAPLVSANSAEVPWGHFLTHLPDEIVIDANVVEGTSQGTTRCTHRRPKEGHEEDQPDQKTPECTPACTRARSAV